MLEAKTYDDILQEVLNTAPEGIDTRQGSIFYDAVSAVAIKIAELYTDIELISELTQIDTASGEYLDSKASEHGITRHSATNAKYNVTFEGVTPESGERFFTDGEYFALAITDDVMYLEAEAMGTKGNTVLSGTPAIPVNDIVGLTGAVFGSILEYGADTESDESLRQRIHEKISGQAENGNKQHYKTWCESFDGVGKARIFPLWNGPNTVKAVLINPLGLPCSDELTRQVQNYIDPAEKGYTTTVDGVEYVVGDGLGDGVANLGAHFTSASAQVENIDISFTAETASNFTSEDVKSQAKTAIAEHFKNMVLTAENPSDVVVRFSSVGAIIAGLEAVLDYSNLTINGNTENIPLDENSVPVLSEVTVNASV